MQVSVEKVNSVLRRLNITVPVDQIEIAYTDHLNKLMQTVKIDGYRPGKAPKAMIEKRFGGEARREVLGEVIQKALYEAIASQNLHPINMPRVEPKVMTPDQPLEFTATFEVLPEIGTVNCALQQVEQLKVDILDSDIERVLDQLRKQYTKWTIVDRAAKEKDRVVIDYYAIFEGKSDIDNKVDNFPLELGSNVMLPGFEEGLLAAKVGDEKTLNLAFPADFANAERAGKTIDFVVTIKQVYEAEVPELNADFIQKLGIKEGDKAELQKQIRQSLEQERDRLVREKLKEQLFQQLLEQNPIDVPESLVEREAKKIHDEVYHNRAHDHHSHSHDELEQFNDIAKKRVSLGLLVAEYAKKAELKLDKERVTARVIELASAYEKPQEVIDWLNDPKNRGGIEAQIMEDQVVDKLLEGVTVNEKTMSYAELKGIRI